MAFDLTPTTELSKLAQIGKQTLEEKRAKEAFNAGSMQGKDAILRHIPVIQEQTTNEVLAKLGIHPGYNAPDGLSTQLLKG